MRLAVVGAGLAGLAAAYALRDASVAITCFEKSRGVSGRCTTRRRHGVRYDHGPTYFRLDTERLRRLVTEDLPAERLAAIDAPVGTFDAEGRIDVPKRKGDDGARWTYDGGIHTLGKLLADASGAEVRTRTRIDRLARTPEGTWTLGDTEGGQHAGFDAVLVTPPAPQSEALLRASAFDPALRTRLADALAEAAYDAQFAFIFGYDTPVERPGGCFALRGTGETHPVAWLAFEHAKPGRLPASAETEALLVAQMHPGWTRAHFEDDRDALAREVADRVADLLDAPAPAWHDVQRWRYSLPTRSADANGLRAGASAGLFFAGDAIAGQGRVPRALDSGLDVASDLRAFLEGRHA